MQTQTSSLSISGGSSEAWIKSNCRKEPAWPWHFRVKMKVAGGVKGHRGTTGVKAAVVWGHLALPGGGEREGGGSVEQWGRRASEQGGSVALTHQTHAAFCSFFWHKDTWKILPLKQLVRPYPHQTFASRYKVMELIYHTLRFHRFLFLFATRHTSWSLLFRSTPSFGCIRFETN